MRRFVLAIGLICGTSYSMDIRITNRRIIQQQIDEDSALCASLAGLAAMFASTTVTYAYCHQKGGDFDQCKNIGLLASAPLGLITAATVFALKARQLYNRYYGSRHR